MKGVMRFGKKGKLSPRYIRPYKISKRVRYAHWNLGCLNKEMYNPDFRRAIWVLEKRKEKSKEEKEQELSSSSRIACGFRQGVIPTRVNRTRYSSSSHGEGEISSKEVENGAELSETLH
ncbi:hypothetical protein MTR67_023643 [Solanum verrucosum]|uniref:Uncharacterized protein n=1 Tax=Solanum verrucosum TaxID=315347 RepID=A0AAF0QXJ1_SOLVR|nr:hypothetical protein MTR67_023643 [Solanum verrucosum]